MGKQIEISDELFAEVSMVADQQSVDPGSVIEYWAKVGRTACFWGSSIASPAERRPRLLPQPMLRN